MNEVDFLALVNQLDKLDLFSDSLPIHLGQIKDELEDNHGIPNSIKDRAIKNIELVNTKLVTEIDKKINNIQKQLLNSAEIIDSKLIDDGIIWMKSTLPLCYDEESNDYTVKNGIIEEIEILHTYRKNWDSFIVGFQSLRDQLNKIDKKGKLPKYNELVELTSQKQREFSTETNRLVKDFQVEISKLHEEIIHERDRYANLFGILQSLDLSGEFSRLNEKLRSFSPDDTVEYFSDEETDVQTSVSREVALRVLPKRWLKFLRSKISEYLNQAEKVVVEEKPIPETAKGYLDKIDRLDFPEGLTAETLLTQQLGDWDIGDALKKNYRALSSKISELMIRLEDIRKQLDRISSEKPVERYLKACDLRKQNGNEVFFLSNENGLTNRLEYYKKSYLTNLELRVSRGKTKIRLNNAEVARTVFLGVKDDLEKRIQDVPTSLGSMVNDCLELSADIINSKKKIIEWIESPSNPKDELEKNDAKGIISTLFERLAKIDIKECEELSELQNRVTACCDIFEMYQNVIKLYYSDKSKTIQDNIDIINSSIEQQATTIPGNLRRKLDQALVVLRARLSLVTAKAYIETDLSLTRIELDNLRILTGKGIPDEILRNFQSEMASLEDTYRRKLENEVKIRGLLSRLGKANPSIEFDTLYDIKTLAVIEPLRVKIDEEFTKLTPKALKESEEFINSIINTYDNQRSTNNVASYYSNAPKQWHDLRKNMQRIERINPELFQSYTEKTQALDSYLHGFDIWINNKKQDAIVWFNLAREKNPILFSDVYHAFLLHFTYYYDIPSLSTSVEKIMTLSQLLKTNPILNQDLRLIEQLVMTKLLNADEIFNEDPVNYDSSISLVLDAKKSMQLLAERQNQTITFVKIQQQLAKIEGYSEQQGELATIQQIIDRCIAYDRSIRVKKQVLDFIAPSTKKDSDELGRRSKSGEVILAFHLVDELQQFNNTAEWWKTKRSETASAYREMNIDLDNGFDELDKGLALFILDNQDPKGQQARDAASMEPLRLPDEWKRVIDDTTGGSHPDLVSYKDQETLSKQVLLLKSKKFQYDTLKTVFGYFDCNKIPCPGGSDWINLTSQLQTDVNSRNILLLQSCYFDTKKIVDEIRNQFSAARIVDTKNLQQDLFSDFEKRINNIPNILTNNDQRRLLQQLITNHRTISSLRKDISREKDDRISRFKSWIRIISFLHWQQEESKDNFVFVDNREEVIHQLIIDAKIPEAINYLNEQEEIEVTQCAQKSKTKSDVLNLSYLFVLIRIRQLRLLLNDSFYLKTRSIIEEAKQEIIRLKTLDPQDQTGLIENIQWNEKIGFELVSAEVNSVITLIECFRRWLTVVVFGEKFTENGEGKYLGKPYRTGQFITVKDLKRKGLFSTAIEQIDVFVNYNFEVVRYLTENTEIREDIGWFVIPLMKAQELKQRISKATEKLSACKTKIQEMPQLYQLFESQFETEMGKRNNFIHNLFSLKGTPTPLQKMYDMCPDDPNYQQYYSDFGLLINK